MPHYHAVVWIDHQKGTVRQFSTVAHARRHFSAIDRIFAAESRPAH